MNTPSTCTHFIPFPRLHFGFISSVYFISSFYHSHSHTLLLTSMITIMVHHAVYLCPSCCLSLSIMLSIMLYEYRCWKSAPTVCPIPSLSSPIQVTIRDLFFPFHPFTLSPSFLPQTPSLPPTVTTNQILCILVPNSKHI